MPEDPFREAVGGWLLGSPKFVDRVRAGMTLPSLPDAIPAVRRLGCYSCQAVQAAVAEHYGIAADSFSRQRSDSVSDRLAGEGVDARDASGAVGGFRADLAGLRAQPVSPARRSCSAISLRFGPASAPRRRRASLRSMVRCRAHSWTAATRKPRE
jgi:hypothetical protein